MNRASRVAAISILSIIMVLVLASCGSDPTPTAAPKAIPTATPVPAPTATTAPAAPAAPAPTATPVPPPAPTATPSSRDFEAYFTKKTITLNVGFSPGGGYDTFSRLVAKFIPKHIPGSPRTVVRNLPGGGGERMLVDFGSNAQPTGYELAIIHPRFFKRELVGDDVPEFDIATINILGTPSSSETGAASYMFKSRLDEWGVTHDWAGVLDMIEKRGTPLTDGGTAPGDSGAFASSFMQALGQPIKMVFGYGGSAEIASAFDRGELDTGGGSKIEALNLFPEWLDSQVLVPIFRYGAEPEDDPEFADYITNILGAEMPPHIFDLIETTQGQRDIFNLTETVNDVLSRVFALPPDTPQDVVEFWKVKFEAIVADEEFVAAAEMLGRPVQYGSPESMIEALDAGRKALEDPDLLALFSTIAGVAD
jgi:hypothetical protein